MIFYHARQAPTKVALYYASVFVFLMPFSGTGKRLARSCSRRGNVSARDSPSSQSAYIGQALDIHLGMHLGMRLGMCLGMRLGMRYTHLTDGAFID